VTGRLRIVAVLTAELVLAGLLVWTGPEPADVHAAIAAPQLWLERGGPDAAAVMLVGLLCWAMLGWVAFGLLLIAGAAAPGAAGRAADALAGSLVPAAVRRAVAVALGVSVGTAAATGTAAADVTPPPGPQTTGPAVAVGHDPGRPQGSYTPESPRVDWPLDPVPAEQPRGRDDSAASPGRGSRPAGSAAPDQRRRQPPGASSTPSGTATNWPAPQPGAGATTSRVGTRAAPGPVVTGASPRPGRNADQSHRAGAGPPAPAEPRSSAAGASPADSGSVQVRPGDCLWLIAARRLGPGASAADVAREWPRWYALNQDVIGGDPAVIRPGVALVPPPAPVRRA
jgi:hypothetical protein